MSRDESAPRAPADMTPPGPSRRGRSRVGRRWPGTLVGIAVVAAFVWFAVPALRPPDVEEGAPADLPNPDDVYDPVAAGEPLPPGYRDVTVRDRIRPVYAPRFTSAAQADWPDDTLVLGVAMDGEAKAYPILTLNFREMVLDRLGGTPILATW